jgi:hypothetical protein
MQCWKITPVCCYGRAERHSDPRLYCTYIAVCVQRPLYVTEICSGNHSVWQRVISSLCRYLSFSLCLRRYMYLSIRPIANTLAVLIHSRLFNKISLFLYCSITRGNRFALNGYRIFVFKNTPCPVCAFNKYKCAIRAWSMYSTLMSHEKLWTEAWRWERVRQNGTEILSRWFETHWRPGFLISGLENVCLPLRTVWWGYCHSNRFQVSASSELRWQARLTIVLVVSVTWKVDVTCMPSGTPITRP